MNIKGCCFLQVVCIKGVYVDIYVDFFFKNIVFNVLIGNQLRYKYVKKNILFVNERSIIKVVREVEYEK